MNRGFNQTLKRLLGVDAVRPEWRVEFAAHTYRVSAERALRVAWAVLLVDLPLFLLVDWNTYAAGSWATQPAHERIVWWRIGLTLGIALLLLTHHLRRDDPRRDAAFAWASFIWFPILGVWFAAVCQTLITDASIYAMFLIAASVLFPLPGAWKLLLYPGSLTLLLLGIYAISPDPVLATHTAVNAACASIGALVTQAVAMRAHLADFTKSRLLEEERERSETLLRNVLPPQIAERMKQGGSAHVEYHQEVSILFADFVGFGALTQRLPPGELIGLLDHLFLEFDEAADRFGVEKIKTMGDSYMAACGVPNAVPDHAPRVAELALRIHNIAARFRSDRKLPVHLRIGLHSGPAIAGVIGRKRFSYDLWGDTVNLAHHLQSSCTPDGIHISAQMRDTLNQAQAQAQTQAYPMHAGEPINLKDRPSLQTYYLLGRVGETAVQNGILPVSVSHHMRQSPR